MNNIVDLVYFHTEETAQAELFTRIDRWEKDCRDLSVEAYHLNMNDTHVAHWRELIADVPPELGRTWSRYWDASNAKLWTIDLSTSTSENQSNEQNPDAMTTPVWQENPTWAGRNFVSGMTKLADHSYLSTTGDRTDRGLKSIQSGDILCIFYSGGPVFAFAMRTWAQLCNQITSAKPLLI